MVVSCPKCKTKLKVNEEKISPEGTRFKCPKCSAVLSVRKPAAPARKNLDSATILVAHENQEAVQKIVSILSAGGYKTVISSDGIDTMVKALKLLPFLVIAEVALPKIYGFEVCKRLKSRAETKEIKFILLPSIYDKKKYRRDPVSLYGADDYLEEHELAEHLIERINALKGIPPETKKAEQPAQPEIKEPPVPKPLPVEEPPVKAVVPPPAKGSEEEKIERARRLARTIINDIYLYNTAKVDDAVRHNTFLAVFTAELKEGQKLYDSRIPQEIRNIDNYYKEAIDNFIASKKKSLS